ncbi:hypothetical protein BC940DRAFT_320328 [Gongronella butleri]|nr:hypothetical protein BC940DRAFT_320328 [Gongronella butleri]
MVLSTLPIEIILRIRAGLAVNDLKALRLTCRSWHFFSTKLLFSSTRIYVHDFDGLLGLLTLLVSTRSMAHYIERVNIGFNFEEFTVEHLHKLDQLFLLCPNITEVDMHYPKVIGWCSECSGHDPNTCPGYLTRMFMALLKQIVSKAGLKKFTFYDHGYDRYIDKHPVQQPIHWVIPQQLTASLRVLDIRDQFIENSDLFLLEALQRQCPLLQSLTCRFRSIRYKNKPLLTRLLQLGPANSPPNSTNTVIPWPSMTNLVLMIRSNEREFTCLLPFIALKMPNLACFFFLHFENESISYPPPPLIRSPEQQPDLSHFVWKTLKFPTRLRLRCSHIHSDMLMQRGAVYRGIQQLDTFVCSLDGDDTEELLDVRELLEGLPDIQRLNLVGSSFMSYSDTGRLYRQITHVHFSNAEEEYGDVLEAMSLCMPNLQSLTVENCRLQMHEFQPSTFNHPLFASLITTFTFHHMSQSAKWYSLPHSRLDALVINDRLLSSTEHQFPAVVILLQDTKTTIGPDTRAWLFKHDTQDANDTQASMARARRMPIMPFFNTTAKLNYIKIDDQVWDKLITRQGRAEMSTEAVKGNTIATDALNAYCEGRVHIILCQSVKSLQFLNCQLI